MRAINIGLSLALLAVAPAYAQQAQQPQRDPLYPSAKECGPLENAYGPFDYTDPTDREKHLPVVENYHFNRDVYELRKGMTGINPIGDLEYTLHAFPNHHLALDAIARMHRAANSERISVNRLSISCWFERAQRFRPNDGMVPMIYGAHLFALERFDKAKEALLVSVRLMPQSPEAHYNLGLVLAKLREYPQAREQAEKAYALGFQLPGLREQLQRVGQWTAGN